MLAATYVNVYCTAYNLRHWVRQFHQNVEISGLHYIACSLGEVISSVCSGYIMDVLYKRRKNKDQNSPEGRLPFDGSRVHDWMVGRAYIWLDGAISPSLGCRDVGIVIMLTEVQLGS